MSNDIKSSTIPRSDLNNKVDTIPTVWIQFRNKDQNLDFVISGVYCRSRISSDLMKSEFNQLQHQIFKAAQTEKTVLVLGDVNVDHNNPQHLLTKEANGCCRSCKYAAFAKSRTYMEILWSSQIVQVA